MQKEAIRRWKDRFLEEAGKLVIKGLLLSAWGGMLAAIVLLLGYWGKLPHSINHWISGLLVGMAAVVAGAFLWNRSEERKYERARNAKHSTGQKGILDFRVDVELGIRRLVDVLGKISDQHGKLGRGVAFYTSKLNASRAAGGNAVKELHIAAQAARHINRSSGELETLVDQYRHLDTAISSGLDGLVGARAEDMASQRDIERACAVFLNALPGVIASQAAYKESSLSVLGVSADLNNAIGRHVEVVEVLMASLEGSQSKFLSINQAAKTNLDGLTSGGPRT